MRLTDEQVKVLVKWAEDMKVNTTGEVTDSTWAALEVAEYIRDNGHRCSDCNEILGAKYRQDIPKKGDLCMTCYEEWFNAEDSP